MDDIRQWLHQHELEEYADAFLRERIGLRQLPELTEEDLRELGLPMGPRKELLRRVRDERNVLASPSEQFDAPVSIQESSEAERRQLTVMFCDLVGSTSLSESMDPEEYRDLLGAYQSAARATILQYEGYIARYMGDGLLVYFSYPQAHEDDAERSVRAGLDLVRAVRELDVGIEGGLAVRIGIATGLVVVGDIVGEGGSEERAVLGDTPNTAARLQGIASPNAVVLAETTQRLVDGRFELVPLGATTLRGLPNPQNVWTVIGEKAVASRFQAALRAAPTAMVGRDTELALLRARWETALSGEGQVALLSGEPGIGKSRLAEAMARSIGGELQVVIRYQCSPFHEHSAFYPFTQQLQHAARISPSGDDDDARLDKLEALLKTSVDRPKALALFASLLLLPAARYPTLSLTPEQQKAQTIDALAGELKALGELEPILLIFEDAHWVDPSSRQVLDAVIGAIRALPVLMLLTHRPEFQGAWDVHGHVTVLRLNRLSQRHSADIVREVAGIRHVPEAFVQRLLARTDGVPLFIEELTKTVLEAGVLEESLGSAGTEIGPEALTIPESLSDSLMARLDRLGAVKELAQLASVIGRTFDYALLEKVANMGADALDFGLGQLMGSGLAFRRGRVHEETYEFKHALVRDTAYESVLRSTRRGFHRRVADALESGFPDQKPELIAHHFTEAGAFEEAVPYWQAAGNRAAQASANPEAIEHFSRGLSVLGELAQSEIRDRKALAIAIALLTPMAAATGFSSPEMEAAISRALILCEKTGETMKIFPVLYRRWSSIYVRGNGKLCLERAQEFEALASSQGDHAARLVAQRILGTAHVVLGDIPAAHKHFETALESFNTRSYAQRELTETQDIGVELGIPLLALTQGMLGYPDKASQRIKEGITQAQLAHDPNTRCYAFTHAAWPAWVLRDTDILSAVTPEFLSLTRAHALPMWTAYANFYHGAYLGLIGQHTDALAHLGDAEAEFERVQAGLSMGHIQLVRAESLIQLNRLDEAKAALELARCRLAGSGVSLGLIEPEYGRLWAVLEALRTGGPSKEAEEHLQAALNWAVQRKVKLFELRLSTQLARFWCRQGMKAEALALLAPVYEWFTEGFGFFDLKEAKALLDEIS